MGLDASRDTLDKETTAQITKQERQGPSLRQSSFQREAADETRLIVIIWRSASYILSPPGIPTFDFRMPGRTSITPTLDVILFPSYPLHRQRLYTYSLIVGPSVGQVNSTKRKKQKRKEREDVRYSKQTKRKSRTRFPQKGKNGKKRKKQKRKKVLEGW